jgi:DNA-binding MarR family transcriptional regulator
LIDRMPNVSRLLNKLMEKGLIKKVRDTIDQRVVHVKLTPEGKKVVEKGRMLFDQVQYGISNKEAEVLSEILDKLRTR